jgi:hypothetical protein
MTEHRVPMLGGAWRHHSDPMRSPDPRVRELVGVLAGLEVTPAPRPEFRAELRAQLVAVAPRLVAEGESGAPPSAESRVAAAEKAAQQAAAADRPRRRIKILKPLVAAACVLTAFVLLLGGAVLISRNALPGDALYGIKRASEDTEYSLTGGSVAKGKLKLEFAARRIGEVAALLPRASALAGGTGAVADGAINPGTAGLVRDTLGSADSDIRTAAQLLGGAAVRNNDPGPLEAITAWTPGQLIAMQKIVNRIPAGGLRRSPVATLALVRKAQQRAEQLLPQLGCSCLSTMTPDDLGPMPCPGGRCTSATPHATPRTRGSPTATPTRGTHSSGRPVAPATRPGTSRAAGNPTATPAPPPSSTVPAPGRHTRPGGGVSPSPTGAPTSPTLPGLPTPTLPGLGGNSSSGHPHLPITVTSSCVSLSAGPVQIGIGKC